MLAVTAGEGQSGLLLGVHIPNASAPATYKTYWITVEDGSPKLAAVLDDVVVPRKDGFWRIGVYETSYTARYRPESFIDMPQHGDLYFQDIASSLYVVPVTQVPKVEVPESVEKPLELARPKQKDVGEEDSAPDEGPVFEEPCNSSQVEIVYVDPRRIGFMSSDAQTEYCAPARYATFKDYELLFIDDYLSQTSDLPAKPIEIATTLTPAQRRAFLDQIEVDHDNGETDAGALAKLQIVPARGKGRWELAGKESGSIASRGDHLLEQAVPAPSKLIPQSPAPPALAKQLQNIPELQDYFVSTKGDLAVALVGQRLVAYSIVSGKLGRAVELQKFVQPEPTSANAVMAEWAFGNYVRVWDKQLRSLKLSAVEVKRVKQKE